MGEIKKIELVLWHKCNCRCAFCCAGSSTGDQFEPRRAVDTLIRYRKQGVESVAFGGGEPTIYPGLPALISAARDLGYSPIEIKSNGMRFCYPEYVQDCIKSGADLFTISLWGHNAETHDRLAGRAGAFEMTEMGIKHLAHYGAQTHVDFLVSSLTVEHSADIAEKLARLGVRRINLWVFSVFGAGGGMKDLTPKLERAGRAALEAAKAAARHGAGAVTSHIPPCLMQGRTDLYFSITELKLLIVTPGGHSFMAEESPFEAGEHVTACGKCAFREICAGPRREYLEMFGHDEIRAWPRS